MGMGNVYCYYGRSIVFACRAPLSCAHGLDAELDCSCTCIMEEASHCRKTRANQRLRFRYGVAVLLGDTHMLQVHLVLSFHAHVTIGDRVRGP